MTHPAGDGPEAPQGRRSPYEQPVRYGAGLWLAALVLLVAAAGLWPGDPGGEPATLRHLLALLAVLLAVVLVVYGAVFFVVAVVAGTWRVRGFDLVEYLRGGRRRK